LKQPYATYNGLVTCLPVAFAIVCPPTNAGGDEAFQHPLCWTLTSYSTLVCWVRPSL
jgi:hypothetical protein